jgi:DDE superfamily endonuclease
VSPQVQNALKKLEDAAAEEKQQYPEASVEIWAMDEHRIGLKPITRRIWAPKGQRPIALGNHRYEWLYVWGFVEPETGNTVWNISNGVCKELFERILADFAKSVQAGKMKRIILQLDQAGWHGPKNLTLPDGIRLVFQPAHSPELQPAEHLWPFVDEPLVNVCFESIQELDKTVGKRCVEITEQQETIRASTLFHWWPTTNQENMN